MSDGSRSQTDLTFFINEPNSGISLYDRFNNILAINRRCKVWI